MCGIAGCLLRDQNASLHTVAAMCDQIRHRGPDDEGFYVNGGCAIGMRRLSIIDLSTGHQPIANEDGSIWVVFNGEIYNYRDLRQELIGYGHRFTTASDTEILVHLYEQWGIEGIPRLRGMYACAVWDSRLQRLLLIRDRFGKKPLYYAVLPQGLFFASEIKCLRAASVPLDVDEEALRLYFQFGFIPDPYSAFRAIRKLPPGAWLEYSRDGSLRTDRYWRPPAPVEQAPAGAIAETELCESIRQEFDRAVAMRMIADVPLGAFLSGGLDSGSVVASMALQSSRPVKTFSIGFEESSFNELRYAAMVAKRYGTEHHEILVRPDSVSLVNRLVHHFDEPFADSSAIPTFLVSEFAAQHVKVALSGDGGDELFGGYESFFEVERYRFLDRVPAALRSAVSRVAGWLPYAAYGKNYLRMISRPSALERYFEATYSPYFLRERLLEPSWLLPADAAFLSRAFADFLLPGGAGILSQAMYFEMTAKLSGDMLVKVDRMSMANSLEVRCPLLDHVLAELACSIPHAWKIRNRQGKWIWRKALGDRLPPELLTRPKMGFGVPLPLWLRGPLKDFLWDYLTAPRFLQRGFVSSAFLMQLLNEHATGRRDNTTWLWTLLMLELWYRSMEPPL